MPDPSSPLRVLVTGAAGQIAYSFLPKLCSGEVFGSDTPLRIHLLDLPQCASTLEGLVMEMEDCGFSLVQDICVMSDLSLAFDQVQVAILIGGLPRRDGMLRKDLIGKNSVIFKKAGEALEQYAHPSVKVLVVANPANTNCAITMQYAPKIPQENFTCLTRLDQERLKSLVSRKVGKKAELIRRVVIWGNHSQTQYPDLTYAELNQGTGSSPSEWSPLNQHVDSQWCLDECINIIQQRGAAVIRARKLSSAMSAANAIAAHLRDWCHGTIDSEDYVSMGISSKHNTYGVPHGLVFSFPVYCIGNWRYKPVEGLRMNPDSGERMRQTIQELQEEKELASQFLKACL